MFPVSGAEQFIATGMIHGFIPDASAVAYFRLLNPALPASRNRVHRPASRALTLNFRSPRLEPAGPRPPSPAFSAPRSE